MKTKTKLKILILSGLTALLFPVQVVFTLTVSVWGYKLPIRFHPQIIVGTIMVGIAIIDLWFRLYDKNLNAEEEKTE